MKKEHWILFVLIVLCVVTMPFVTYAQQTSNRKPLVIEDQGTRIAIVEDKPLTDCGYSRPIKVAGFVSNPPFSWVERDDRDNLMTYGYSVDVFDKIAKKLGLKYETVGFTSYDDTIGALKRSDIDLLLSAYLPQGLGFGVTPLYPAYFKNVFTVYFLAGKEHTFSSVDDLAKYKGIIRNDENIYKLFQNKKALSGLNLERVKTSKKAFTMLLNEEADYLIGSPYSTEAELRRFKLQDKIVSSRVPILDASLFFILSSNSSCMALKKMLQDEITAYIKSGTGTSDVRSVVDKWGEMFRYDAGLLPEEEKEENDDWMDPNW